MGIAQYNRGTAAISRSFDREARPVVFDIMDRLSALPKHADARAPFGPMVFTAGNGGFWALESADSDSFGFWYPSLAEAVKSWRCVVTGYTNGFWTAIPAE